MYVNGVHIPIPDELVKLGKAANLNDGGRRTGPCSRFLFADQMLKLCRFQDAARPCFYQSMLGSAFG